MAGEARPSWAEIEARPALGKTMLLGLQHVLAMYAGAVAVPLILGQSLGLDRHQTAFLVQADLLTCGLATLLQAHGLGPHLGIRMPVILGVTFAAVSPMVAIGQHLGLPYVYGAILAASLVAFLLAPLFGRLRRFFPPVVVGSIVTLIGASLIPIAMDWVGGGKGAAELGAPRHLGMALGVLVFVLAWMKWAKGFWGSLGVLAGLVMGSLVAWLSGWMDLSAFGREDWIAWVHPLRFGWPRFEFASVLIMSLVLLVCMVESTGVFFAIGEITGAEVEERDITRGLKAEAVSTFVGALLNSFPYTTFSENVGLVVITGVKSRYVLVASGGILVVLGFFPKLGALVASIPPPVLGGVGLVMFGMVAAAGIHILSRVAFRQLSNQLIVATTLGLGLGISSAHDLFLRLPDTLHLILSNGIVVGSLAALVLNAWYERECKKAPVSEVE